MCQMCLHTEFQLPIMFCTCDIYSHSKHKGVCYVYVAKPFKCDNNPKFYLLVSDDAIF